MESQRIFERVEKVACKHNDVVGWAIERKVAGFFISVMGDFGAVLRGRGDREVRRRVYPGRAGAM